MQSAMTAPALPAAAPQIAPTDAPAPYQGPPDFAQPDLQRPEKAREFIAFRAQGQDFCIDILAVREIRGWTRAAALPHAPHYVEGVINLRGAIVPIFDLAAKLGLPRIPEHDRNVIIVTVVGKRVVGLLVETVTDIFSAAPDAMHPVPDLTREEAHAALSGMIVESGRLIRIVDLEALLPTPTQGG